MKFSFSQHGMSLIETVLYVALFSILIFSLSAFLVQLVYQTQIKQRSISEVEQQGQRVMRLITQAARNSTAIVTPTFGSTGASLSVGVPDATNSPTLFSVSNGTIQITEGAVDAIDLTSSRVTASGFTIQNVSSSGTAGSVRIQFTLDYNSTSARNEYQYTKTFYGTATLR